MEEKMRLDRTIIIPNDDNELAQRLFKSVVDDEDVLVVVVLGDGEEKEKIVELADKRARVVVQGFGRKVIWIRNVSNLETEIRNLTLESEEAKEKMGADKALTDIALFSISLTNTVMGVIKNNEKINILRIDRVFIRAGEAEVD